jgi:hypothetical protein
MLYLVILQIQYSTHLYSFEITCFLTYILNIGKIRQNDTNFNI